MKVSSGVKFRVIIALFLALAVTFSAALWSALRSRENTALAETDSAAIARKLNGAANDWKTETVVTVGSEADANGAVITIDENKASVTAITIPSGARVTVNGVEPSVQRELENTAVYSQLVFDVPVTVKAESVLTFNADVVFRAGVTVEGTLIINGMAFNQNGTMLVSNAANNYAEIRSEGVVVNGTLNNDGVRGGQITVSEGATLAITPSTTSSYIENGQRKEFPNYDGGALFLKAGESGASGLSVSGSLKNEGSVIYDSTISAAPVTNGTVVSATFINAFDQENAGNGSSRPSDGEKKGMFYSLSDQIYVFYDNGTEADGTKLDLTVDQTGQIYDRLWFSGQWNNAPISLTNTTLLSFGRTVITSGTEGAVYQAENVNLGGGTSGSAVFTQGANELIFDGGAKWTQAPSGNSLRFILGEDADVQTVYENSGVYSSSALFNVYTGMTMYDGVKITRHETRAGSGVGGGMKVYAGATLSLYGGEISYNAVTQCSNDGAGGGIYSAPNTKINIYNAQVTRNALATYSNGSADGAGIAMDGTGSADTSVLTLYGGEISYNCGATGGSEKAADGGGIIGRVGTTVNMYGGYIRGNWTGGFGGAMLLYSNSKLVMTGGSISDNWAAFGGGINMTVSSSVDVSGGELSGNTAFYNSVTSQGGYGGAICVGAASYTTTLSAKFSGTAVVSGNRALYGGGLAVYTDASSYSTNKLEMSGGTITGNGAYTDSTFATRDSSRGDGVYFYSANACSYPILSLSGNASIDSSNNVSFNIPTWSTTAPIQVTGKLTASGLAALVRLESESSWSGKSIVSYASSDDIDRNKFLLDSTQYSFYENGNALSIHSVSTSTDYVAEVYDGTNTSLQERYTSLEEAVSAAADGQMIRVLRSATIASPITISGKNLTIVPQEGVDITIGVASGFQLSADTKALFTVNGGSLTIGGSTSGKIAFDGNKSSGADMSLVYVSSGSFTLEADATLRNNSSSGNAGAVFLGENTSATIRGTIADTSGQFGAIYVSNYAVLTVDGATFSGRCQNEKGENYAVYAIGENSKVILDGEVNFGGAEKDAVPYDGNAIYMENRITLGDNFRNAGFAIGVTFPAARTAGTTIVEIPQTFVSAWNGAPVGGYASAADYADAMFDVANMDADYMLIVSNADTAVANALVVSKSVVFVFDFTYTDGYDADSSQNGSVTFPGDLEKLLNDYTPAISDEQLGRIHTRGKLVVLELQSGSNFPLAAFSEYAAWEGYSLIRWEVNGTDTSYDYNGNIAYLDSEQEVSVRSVWVSNTYHFTFDTNRVTGSNTSGFQGFGGEMKQQTVDYDDADKSLHVNTYTLVGWRFTGWNTLAGGNGTAIGDGETPDLTAIATGTPTYTTGMGEDGKPRITGAEYNITLYAQWLPIFSGAGVGTAASPFVLKTVNDLYVLEATVNGTEKGTDQSADCAALVGYKNSNADDGSAAYTAEDYSGYYFKLDGAFDNASAPFTGVIGRVSTSPVAGGAHENDGAENYLDQEDQISRAIYGEVSATAGGTGVAAGTPFKGTFDGNGRTVQLNINKQAVEGGNGTVAGDETLVGAGMFGYTDHATIRNLTLSGTVHGYAHVGGLVGYAFGGTISDIYNGAKITSGGHDVGGVIGTFFELTGNYAQSSVTNAANAGEISYQPREGEDKTYRLDIDSDWNELEVMPDAVGVRFGGIVGAGITLRLTGGYNLGSVTARYGAGGVVGTLRSMSNSISDDAVIAQSFNAGAVTATAGLYASYTLGSGYKQNFITAYTGGITGRLVGVSSVSYSYNSGDVRATFAAKIVSADGTVSNEDDYVYLTSTENAEAGTYLGARGVGGIVGFTSFDVTAATQNGRMAISNVYNTGDITSWAGVGGIAGYLAYSNITNSFNGGNVTATGFHFDAGGMRYAGGYMLTAGSNTVYTAYLGAIVGRGVSASLDATVSYNINAAYTGLTDATVQAIGDSNYNAQFGLDQNITSAIGLMSSQMRVDANGSAPSGFVSTFNSTGWSFYHYVGETAESGSVTYSYYPQISAFANGEGTSENLVGGTPVDLAKYSKDSAQIKYRVSSEEGEEDTPVTDETTFRLTFMLNGGEFGFSADGEDSEGHIYHIFADKNKHYYEAGSGNWYYVFGYPVDKVDYVSEEGQAVGAGVLEQPDAPSRVGYTFAGWYVDSGYTEAFSFGAIPGQHTTVYAKWEPIVYTITYENVVGVGGTWVGDYNKTFDIQTSGKVTLPTDVNLERRGYVFSGWKYSGVEGYITQYSVSAGNSPSILLQDAGGMNKATVPFSALTAGTLVLTAEWTAEPYSIQYRTEPKNGFADGQSATLHDAVTSYTVLSADFTLPTPQKTGYTFLRWILVSIDGNTDSVSDTINAAHYAIGGAVERIRSNTVGDFVLQAEWERNDITVYLDARGGTIEEYSSLGLQYDGTTGLYYTAVPYYDTLAALLFDGNGWKIQTAGLTGNTFNGWYTNSTATAETVVTSSTRVTVGSGSWTLYAGYEKAKYTLTIDIQGNLPEGVTATIPPDAQNSLQGLGFTFDGGIGLSVFHGDDASSALAELVRAVLIEGATSYYFSSWTISPSGKSIYNVTDHLSLSAHYEENRVTVNFVGRNGEFLAGISVAVNGTVSGDPEAHQDYLDLLNDQRLTKVFGYTFNNAWTYSDGEFNVDTTLITGAMVVYASFTPWKVNPAFTFAEADAAITIDDMTYSFGSAFGTLPTMDELRAAYAEQQGSGDYLGYQIDGFYLDAERTKAVNINTLITEDMWQQSELTAPLALTLYVKISKITYNITFNADGGTFADHGGESTYSGSYQYGEAGSVVGFSLPTRVGYTLSQWYISGVNGVSIGYIPAEEGADYAQKLIELLKGKYAGALNVIAIWEADVYSVWFYAGEDGYFTVPATIPEGVIFCNDADATPVTEAGAKASYCIVGVEYGKVPSIPASVAAKKEGYTFNGWLTSEGQIITAVRAEDTYSSASPITAQWSVSSYTIVFITNGGTSVADKSGVPFGANLNEQLSGITTTRTGYIFRGWFTDSGFQTSYPATMPASSLVLYAKWEIVTSALTLNITLDGVSGAESEVKTAVESALGVTANVTATGSAYRVTVSGVEYGTSLSALNSLSVTYGGTLYTLDGLWISGGVSQPLATMPDHNYEASASFTHKTAGHTVTFYLNDGTETETVYYTLSGVTSVDESLQNVLVPVREGYDFAGWYDAEEDGNEFTFGAALEADAALYAHWTVHEWTITLDLRGGSGTTSVADVEYGTALWTGNGWNTILPEPLRGGYVFNGWYIDSSCTESAENTVMPDSDLTLYAGWTAVKYQLIFEYDSGNETFEAEIGTAIEYPDSSETDKKYYRFTGWLISGGAHDKQAFSYSAMPDLAALDGTEENGVVRLTVIAQYEAIEYSAEYRDEDGAVLGNLTVSADMASEDTAGEENDLLTPLTEKDGYTFVGWRVVYADSSPSDTIYKKYLVTADGMKLVSADGTPSERIPFENVQNIDFYAVYAANTYTVTFESNGGTLQEEEKTKSVEYGSAYGTLPVPVRVGYTFLGWFTAQENGTQITADTAVSDHSDHALYAHWRANTYTVIFIGNGASGSMNPQKVTYGTPVSLTPNAFEREGYRFAVWNTQANGGGKTYGDEYNTSAGDLTSADNDIVILYAQWTDITFTVKFAGGEGATGWMNEQKFVFGAQATLNLNTFVKVGYDFGGWRLDDDTTFGDGDEFTILDNEIPENGVITLTAQWTVKTYTILFDEKDGVPLDDAASVAFTSSVTLPTATREGYAFLGWSTSDNDGNDGNVVYAGGANVPVSLLFTGLEGASAREKTLYAVWKINVYTVTLNGVNVTFLGDSTTEYGAAYKLTLSAAEGYELPATVSYTMGGGEKQTAQVSGGTVTISSVAGDLVIEAAGVALKYTVTVSAGDGGVFTALPDGATGAEGTDGSWTQFTINLEYGTDVTAILNALEVKVNSAYHYLSEWNSEGDLGFLTGALTVTAQYAATEGAIVVTVVHADGKVYTINATYGDPLSESEAFTHTSAGYTYNGWYYLDGEKTETFVLDETIITRPVTVYPNATADKYNVTTESSNVDFVGGGDKVAAYGQSYTVTYLPALGYELSDLSVTMNGQPLAVGDYSYDAATGRLTIDRITGAIEISATVSAKDYTVTFDPNGGELTGNTPQSVTFGEKITKPTTNPTKTGYTFIGWTYNGAAWDFESGTMPASDITLVASWEINVYTVTFTADDTVQSEAEYLHGAKVTRPVDPVKDGYTFLGWYAEGSETAYDFTAAVTGNLALTAEFELIKYTITYVLNGGTNGANPETYTVEMKEPITLNAPSRTGYTFAGWFDADENGSQITAVAGGKTGNITLYARWTANTYTVVFNANGGDNAMGGLTLTYDVAEQLTECTLIRNGYTFAGWATSENGEIAYLDGATVINLASESGEEVMLYAVWTANSYTVTFDGNEGTVQGIGSKQVTFGSAYGTLPTATRTGYTFLGWFTAQTDGEKVEAQTLVATFESHTLYAQWEAIEYTITYYDTDGADGTETQTFTYADEDFAGAVLNSYSRDGYTFNGWATSEGGYVAYADKALLSTLALPTDGKEVHLYAVWTANTYKVTFDSDGGTAVTGQTVAYGGKVSEPAHPTKEGHTFLGWTYNGETWTFESDTMPAENIELVAQWKVNEYTVTFDPNGGELAGSATQSVTFGSKVSEPAQPTREGYTFAEWTYNGAAWDFESNTMPAGNITLIAKWTANSYKIVFHANDGSETTKEQSVTYDEKTALEGNTFTRNGYTFAGWATEENGAVAYLNGATVINLASESGAEVPLYAVWTANSYTVTFDGNEGTVQGIGSKQVTFGSAYGTLPTATRTGYTFLGWFTAQTDGTRVTDVSVVNTATAHTLYAQWEAIEYTITYYDTDGADGTETQTFTYADEDFASAVLNSYSRDGYTFNGWATSKGGYVAYTDKALLSTLALPTDGTVIHLYAVWTTNNYTVTFESDGGTSVTGQTVAYGEKISEPAQPTKEGYTFAGWFHNGELWNFGSDTMPAENIKLVAQWNVNKYTVTFDSNGGTSVTGQTVEYGEKISESAQPTKEGYTFAEWTYNGTAWDFESDTVPAGNITLVAKWTANSYKIVFHANDGSEATKEQAVTYDEKTALEDNTFTRNGYTFADWATEENGAVAYLNGAMVINLASESGEEVHLYAVWTANSYTVTFDGNAGTVQGIGSKQVTFGSAYGALPTATRTGYTFLGWFTAQTDGTRVTDVSVVNTATAHTLYAQWKAIEYTITYYDTDGADGTETQTFTYADEDFASAVLNSYSRDGYTFSGWATSKGGYVAYTDKALLSTLALPTDGDKIALYAVWQINSYTVTVNLTMPDSTDATTLNAVRGYIANALSKWSVSIAESGTSLTVTVSDLVYGTSLADLSALFRTEETYSQITVNDALYLFVWTSAPADSLGASNADYAGGWTNDEVKTVTVSVGGENKTYYLTEKDGRYTFDLGTLAEPAKYGAVFGGWQSSDGNIEENILTVTGENATVTPVWKTISYTVQYGGDTVSTADLVFTWDGTDFMLGGEGGIAELAGGLTRAGYTFAGWKYEELTVFTLEELFANTVLGNAGGMQERVTIKLTAVWAANEYTVRFDGNGATGSMNAQTFVFGTQGTLNPNTFVYVGYDFGGWMWQGKTYQDGQEFTVTEEVLPDEGTVITLTAEWTKKMYTVAYDENGGDTLEDATAAFTASVTLPAATRKGYTFLGWATANDGNVVYAGGANVPVSLLFTGLEGASARERTLYAVWKINAYSVTLSGVNVMLSGAETVGHGSDYTVSLTAVKGYGLPETVSYTVGGGEKQTAQVSGGTVTISSVTGDLVILAEGVADMHLVTVSAGGGGVFTALPDGANGTEGTDGSWTQFTVSLAYGTDVYTTVLNQIRMNVTGAPYQTLYDWTVTAGEKEWLFALGGDLTIVAQYAQEKVSVSIVLPDGTVRSEEVTYAQELDLNGLGIEVEGYTISGWRKGDEPIEGGKLVITAPVAIYAVATANTYEVTLNYGNEQETITVTFGKAFAYSDGWTERPVRDGYTFLGWKHGEDTVSGNQIVGVLGEGYTLVAEWSVNSYTVTFHANGGQLKDKETITVVFGESISVPNAPEREGYTFEGWYYDLVKWDFEKDTMPSRDISLVANWIQNVYKVTFVNDSETSEAQYSHGSTVTQPPVPVKAGYTFLGWYTEGSETAYDFAALVTGDFTLTAEWSAIEYTITYVLNGGANGDNPTDYTIETDTITLNAPSRTGYNFLGWYNAEVDGAEVTEIAKGSTGNLTLHAIWEAKEYTVSFVANGGNLAEGAASQTVAHGGKVAYTETQRENYLFLGWFTDETLTQRYDFNTEVTGDFTLYAKWRLQIVTGTADDGTTVIVSSDAGFDDGTTLQFVRVTEESAISLAGEALAENMTLARLYDIELIGADGNAVSVTQPISVGIGVDDLGEAEGRFSIAYIPEEGMAEELATHIGEDGKLYFFVEHFSHYAVVDITPVVAVPGFAWWWILVVIGGCAVIVLIGMLLARYRRVYELNYVNGGIAPQKLRESSLIDLPLPEREDEVFDGWYYDEEFRDRALLTTMPKQNLILFAKWRRMTDEERIVRDRKRAEAAAAAAEGFHHAEPPKEELHKEEPPREIEEDE